MKEILIYQSSSSDLVNIERIKDLVSTCYNKTGNKFWIEFAGSKGYLSHVEINCEGVQESDNRIHAMLLYCKTSQLQIFHSQKSGVRLQIL